MQGLRKLQLITEAKKVCPDVIIVLGEDLTRFRDASKDLYNYLRAFSWNNKVERLGFDEVWMDVTDIVDYNLEILNSHDLQNSFFQISHDDPTSGFALDASHIAGHAYPATSAPTDGDADHSDFTDSSANHLSTRLLLGSHLAHHLRKQLHEHKNYTCTVGISISKLLSKLVGNIHKPNGQTTLLPPYDATPDQPHSNVASFLDNHDISAIPWIGFKLAQKLRAHFLGRAADFHDGLVYGKTKERITVGDMRALPDLGPEMLERLLGGPGLPRGIGARVYGLLHGIDDAEVRQARNVPRQISIEDSYVRLDTLAEVVAELTTLSRRLLARMQLDLTESHDGVDVDKRIETNEDEAAAVGTSSMPARWMAKPTMLRLTTRPRMPLQADGTRVRTFKRISRSAPLPSFTLDLPTHLDALTTRLVSESLLPLFRKLHPEKSGWNLSLVNVAVTEMVDCAGDERGRAGRDIKGMFGRQDGVLREFSVTEGEGSLEFENGSVLKDWEEEGGRSKQLDRDRAVDQNAVSEQSVELPLKAKIPRDEDQWHADFDEEDEDEGVGEDTFRCGQCGRTVPLFARDAHDRFHADGAD